MYELHEGHARGVVRDDERRGERVREHVRESEKTAVERRGNATLPEVAKLPKMATNSSTLIGSSVGPERS